MALDTRPWLADPDALFALLVEAHRGLSAEESRKLDAKLVLILANHVGDTEVVREAVALAKASGPHPATPP
ncbi:DUF2783 domain-containing protein [Falsiroseomonas sp. HW251]|uniref:DUF2783 domain-containing protein n=1 Tax=Falsiroseomonas sp. HW251 TaxID=3390998 RepID=UPI003D314E66